MGIGIYLCGRRVSKTCSEIFVEVWRVPEMFTSLKRILLFSSLLNFRTSLNPSRTRMVVGVGSKQISGSFLEVIEQQGRQGFWSGNAITMVRIIPTQAIELATIECVERIMTSAFVTYCPKMYITCCGTHQ